MFAQTQTYVLATFQAVVDALLPSPSQAGNKSSCSPINLNVHEYVINGLNNSISIKKQLNNHVVPLAYLTAHMLDAASMQLLYASQVRPLTYSPFLGGGLFSYLSRKDRIRTLSALETLEIDLHLLPAVFQNNGGMVKYVTDALNRLSMFGYYSEWPAYGTTRLNPPDYQYLEFFPPVWQQVGYPGVSLGYRDFRGFLLTMKEVKS